MLNLLAQNSDAAAAGAAAGAALVVVVIYLALVILIIASLWKVFTKAGKPGWAAIVPIYNLVVLIQISGKPVWWILLCLIPFVNFVIIIFIYNSISTNFGRGIGTTLGLIFLPFIFWPILGFGSAKYKGHPTPEPTA